MSDEQQAPQNPQSEPVLDPAAAPAPSDPAPAADPNPSPTPDAPAAPQPAEPTPAPDQSPPPSDPGTTPTPDTSPPQSVPGAPSGDPHPEGGQTVTSEETVPVPEGEKPLEDDSQALAEQKEADSVTPEEAPDTSQLEQNLQSPSQVPPDGDNSQAELKEAPADVN